MPHFHTSFSALERAVLEKVSERHPEIVEHVPFLQVLSRESTGVGMYVNLTYSKEFMSQHSLRSGVLSGDESHYLKLDSLKEPLMYALLTSGNRVTVIEFVTLQEPWDGTYNSFWFEDVR